ncbi:MAG: hypothetical protein AAFN93_26100, partial [Bacteroidota bacterium]
WLTDYSPCDSPYFPTRLFPIRAFVAHPFILHSLSPDSHLRGQHINQGQVQYHKTISLNTDKISS